MKMVSDFSSDLMANQLYLLLSVFVIKTKISNCSETKDICIVDRLFSSSLAAIVSLSSPRKLKVCHFKRGSEICNYSYSNTILAVKLNRVVSLMSPIIWICFDILLMIF